MSAPRPPLWTSEAIAAATGGRAVGAFAVGGIAIDSRAVRPGDLFVALADRRDGHDFAAAALAAGAAGLMLSRLPEGLPADAPRVEVAAAAAALAALGRAGRARFAGRLIAVTGSVGKTSTKEMLRSALAPDGPVHAAERSFNNHWGVPLTLARMPADAAFAVVEIGMNHPGEIAPLAALARPHVALVTAIAPAHMAAFASVEEIAAEKAAIFSGLEPGGTAVIPAEGPGAAILAEAARAAGARILTFGEGEGADWRLLSARVSGGATVVEAEVQGMRRLWRIGAAGRHFARNALGALAAAEAAGADPATAALALGRWEPPEGRGRRHRLVLDAGLGLSAELIDDAYNANPASMAAALEVLAASEPGPAGPPGARGRRVAFLGDMLELGEAAAALHAALAREPAMEAVDVVHTAGPLMAALAEALPAAKRGEHHPDAEALAARAPALVGPGDVVLVKGSNGSRIARVVDALVQFGQAQAARG